MDYQVSARKHRPSTFDEVSGQPHVVRTLRNALMSGRTAHAYLFSGMRGVGKTTMARILAKALNCEKGPTDKPCLACSSCQEISRGTSLDVMEIDGASSNSVDDVREMRETVKTAPARDRYRIYIIDEVHMLSTAAFNALLKTLEEPPSHVVFVFATTESHKIPRTILSRCQHFNFRRISRREIMDQLKRVAQVDGIAVDDRSLSALARVSDGSMRDGLSLLDQAVAFGGKQVRSDELVALLGSAPRELQREVMKAILDRDAPRALRAVAGIQDQGCDLRQFCSDLIEHIRNVLVAKIAPDSENLIEAASDETAEITADAARLTSDEIQELFRIFNQTDEALRASQHPWFLLEMAIIRATRSANVATGTPSREPVGAPLGPPGSGSASQKTSGGRANVAATARQEPQAASSAATGSATISASPTLRKDPLKLDWEAVIDRVNTERPNLSAYLEETALIDIEGDTITIGYPASAGASMKMILQQDYQRIVLEACRALSGQSVRLRAVMLNDGSSTVTVAQLRRERAAKANAQVREEALANPLLQEALSVFGGEVQEVRPKQPPTIQGSQPDCPKEQ
jgi:DNA polymerase III subunit gamma/tau